MQAARQRPEIGRVSTLYRATVPQIYADIDRSKVLKVRRAAAGRQHHARRAARQHLRERLQPVRPRLQGVRPGRARVSARSRSSSACSSCAGTSRQMVPLDTLVTSETRRADPSSPIDSISIAPRKSPACRRRATARRRRSTALEERRQRDAAAGDGLRLGRHVVPGEARAQPDHRLRARHLPGVPGAGGAVPELGAAVQRAARDAVRRLRRVLRPLGGAPVPPRATSTTCSRRSGSSC